MVSRGMFFSWSLTLIAHHFEKGIIERTIEYFKDRTENFDNYYPCSPRYSIIWLCIQLDESICMYA